MRQALLKLALVSFAVAGFLLPGQARASTGYPAEIQAELPLTYTPACSICHAGGDTDAGANGETGSVTTAFGETMVMLGLMGGNNIPSLDGALEGLVGEKSPYVADLEDGLDPNNPTSGTIPDITYGCFNVTGEGPVAGPAGVFLLGLALLLLLRRPRSARRTPPARR